MLLLVLAGCQNEIETTVAPQVDNVDRELTFSMIIPDYQPATRATESITRIDLLVFDAKGLFIERRRATDVTINSFKAKVSQSAAIVHVVANMDVLDSFDERANLERSEYDLIPSLQVTNNQLVYWGRSTVTTSYTTTVVLYRNQAKVTAQSNTSSFVITGLALCNYATTGTVSPFINNEFTYSSDIITIGTEPTLASASSADDLSAKYMCEYSNPLAKETFVILKAKLNGGADKYYKVLLTDANDVPYQIVRNVEFKIIIKNMKANVGANTFADAMNAASINHLYAEVMKDSYTISDSKGNSLTVSPLTHLLTKAGSITSNIAIVGNLGNVSYQIISDPSTILSNIQCSDTSFKASVKQVSAVATAKVAIKYGNLARTLTIVASPTYSITATATPDNYTSADTNIKFTFNLDTNYPSATEFPELYPIKCYIKADNFFPVDNKDMLLDYNYKAGEYWFVYWADRTGSHEVNFVNNIGTIDSKIVVESEYFGSATVNLISKIDKTFTISRAKLRAGKNINGATVSIYADATSANSIGTCSFSTKKSDNYQLKSDLTITCPYDTTRIYFKYITLENWNWVTYVSSASTADLQAGTIVTLSWTQL